MTFRFALVPAPLAGCPMAGKGALLGDHLSP
jgi:hypothetical protein